MLFLWADLSAVGRDQRSPADGVGTVPRRTPRDRQLHAGLYRFGRPTAARQDVAATALGHPFLGLAVLVGHLQIDSRMGIREPEFGHDALDARGLIG